MVVMTPKAVLVEFLYIPIYPVSGPARPLLLFTAGSQKFQYLNCSIYIVDVFFILQFITFSHKRHVKC